MKKRISRAVIAAVLALAISLCCQLEAESRVAKIKPVTGDPFTEMVQIRCTCYCQRGRTATGKKSALWHSCR